MKPLHLPYALLPEVILETQLHPSIINRENVYNDILISIGIDSPTASSDERDRVRNKDFNQGQVAQGMNTLI